MTALPQHDPDRPPHCSAPGRPGPSAGPGGGPPELPPPSGAPPGREPPAHGGGAGARIRLGSPAELVAAVPVLVGFHPQDSLVLVGVSGPGHGGRIGLTVRIDLPAGRYARRVCTDAGAVLAGSDPARAVVVVVRRGPGAGASRPVRRDVALAADRALRAAGIEVAAVLWASGTGAGDRWCCYPLPRQRCGCSGTVPDPAGTAVAAAAALNGRAVLPDRAALVAQLDGTADDRARRARLGAVRDSGDSRSADGRRHLLDGCLAAAADGRLAMDDGLVGDFRAALADPAFRDTALRCCLGPDAPHAEQLWAVLTRALPAPDRAEPAALLGVCALLRGDGALAGLAAERALRDRPDHVLGAAVHAALSDALTPGHAPGPFAGPDGLRRLLSAVAGHSTGPGPGGGAAGAEPGR
ncbi:DUF4192 domain-containing protein [Pseudonocardia sp. HH130630-07]|uniref:DUF4192 domain-containing protein n=1 Tax=Pseudonocardia sp. HH130630-07 TaxID=1690815 RepID=UPI0012EA5D66|nr:DUF4192 domain-containing protein [Pseudonocardia sp. HH130630-07]